LHRVSLPRRGLLHWMVTLESALAPSGSAHSTGGSGGKAFRTITANKSNSVNNSANNSANSANSAKNSPQSSVGNELCHQLCHGTLPPYSVFNSAYDSAYNSVTCGVACILVVRYEVQKPVFHS
jgi:hypothetical protein